jgi:anaerobic magnesium-protoporphyrin IX monomethyl ester cyclase
MKICVLDHPRIPSVTRFNDIANTPLWSCLMGGYAAGALDAAGFDVSYLDAATAGMDYAALDTRLAAMAPDLLAVNAVYFWEHTGRLFGFIDAFKRDHAPAHIALFGFFPSLAPAQILMHCPSVDSVCVGECEHLLRDLAAAIDLNQDWRQVPGLAYTIDDRTAFSTIRRPEPDPDRFPYPRRTEGVVGDDTTAAILGSRGCYNHCSFCPIPAFYQRGGGWRGRTPGNILAEVACLAGRGYRRFYFVDPNFIGPGRAGRQRALALMDGLRPLEIRFGMETRPNDLDEELMLAMAGAGLDSLLLGIESASPNVLGTLSKHATAAESRHALMLCRDAGIEPEVGFIMHTPDATLADLARNLDFLEGCRLLDRLDRTANLLCHRQIVFRGTRGFDAYASEGRILETDPLGFEAHITHTDARAAWVADVMVPICHDVLRRTGDPDDPLYWDAAAPDEMERQRVNACLVSLFRDTLQVAQRATHLPAPQKALAHGRATIARSL